MLDGNEIINEKLTVTVKARLDTGCKHIEYNCIITCINWVT